MVFKSITKRERQKTIEIRSHKGTTDLREIRKWIDIWGFEDYILNKALPQIEFSLNKSPRTSSLGIPSIAVGFPKIEKSLRREEIDSQRKNQMMYRAMIVARARFFSIYFSKVIQKNKGRLKILIQPNKYLKSKGRTGLDKVCKKIKEILGPNFLVNGSFVSELKKSPIGKYRYLDQKLKINF